MREARQLTLSGTGAIVAFAGFEHGLGELLQGPVGPEGLVIQSWPDSEFYASLSGEPAMTLIPNLAFSGLLTMALSVALFIWVVWFVGRRYSACVIAGLSVALLLVGGGFGPPVLGLILAAAATRVRSDLPWWRERCSARVRESLSAAWPFLLAGAFFTWLAMLFGVPALAYFFAFESVAFIVGLLLTAFLLLLLALVSSMARDATRIAHA